MPETIIQDADIVESTAIEAYHPPGGLFRTDDPVEVIAQATQVADALKSVVASRGLIANIKGREHPKVEAWQTLGSMLGVFPVKDWVRELQWPVEIPEALKDFHKRGMCFGYEASFVAQRADGVIVGGGEAQCSRTESTWKDRDDFALRSMAQTRATSKALKAPLGFVMVLAGYEATPAEEMPPAEAVGLPFGPEYDQALKNVIGAACTMLAGGESKQGIALFKAIRSDLGDYMPQAAALALIHAAEAGPNRVPIIEAPDPT